MLYKLVQQVEGQMIVSTFDADNVIPAMEIRGFVLTGTNQNNRHRAELQGQPKFSGVNGPMWDGTREDPEGCIRYECPEAYRTLSA